MPASLELKEQGYVSITEVLDYFQPPELVAWKLKIGSKEAKRLSTIALKIGTRVDELIQLDIQNKAVKLSSKDSIEVKNCWKAWLDFKKDYSPEIVAFQEELIYEEQKLVGHLDLRTTDTVIDIKCSSSIKKQNWLQVCKYSRNIMNSAILRLDKNLGVYEFKTHEQAKIDPIQAVDTFDGLLMAYRFYNSQREKE